LSLPASGAHAPDTSTGIKRVVVTEGAMKPFKIAAVDWNALIQSLVLVRLGQELGTDSRLARAVHELLEAVLQTCR